MTEFQRQPTHYYEDPLSIIWLNCAQRVGYRVLRSREVYASTDGRGTLLIAADDQFDPDDNLAQMIFHELCHALVEGESGEQSLDWGLDNTRMGNPWREHACLRLQAWLAGEFGLRRFFAPTTDFRVTFWEHLADDPFAAPAESGGRRERSCIAGRIGAWRASQPRWETALRDALAATAQIALLLPRAPMGALAGDDSSLTPLWDTVSEGLPAAHPMGHARVSAFLAGKTCEGCAWSFSSRKHLRCQHNPRVRLPEWAPACSRFEPREELDCQTCGACCREAYHSVEVSSRDPVNRSHPELILTRDTHRKLRRDGNRCAALSGGRTSVEPYACEIYAERPRTCREFTRGSGHCLDARRRVGLSL